MESRGFTKSGISPLRRMRESRRRVAEMMGSGRIPKSSVLRGCEHCIIHALSIVVQCSGKGGNGRHARRSSTGRKMAISECPQSAM